MNVPAQSRPITDRDRDAIVTPVRDGLRDLIFGSPGLFDDRPGFVAAPESGNPFQDLVRSVTQFNCRNWARNDKSNYSTRVNQGNAAICGPYLDGLGENPPDGSVGPPFQGGQCEARYLFTFSYETGSQSNPSTFFAHGLHNGPISGVSTSGNSVGLTSRGGIQNTSASATNPNSCGNNPGAPQALQFRAIVSGARNPTGLTLTPCGADNCGDPPPEIRPPGQITGGTPPPPSITVNVPGFGPTEVTVNPGPDGGIEVCLPELQVCIQVGDEDDGGEPGEPGEPTPPNGPNENGPGDEGAVGDPGGEDDDGDFGDPPEGRAWIGAFVQFTVPTELGNIPSANPANPAYATVVGNVSLDHGGVFSDAKQARSRWVSCFRENPNLTVKGARVNTRPGVSFRVYPVSVEICPESLCPIGED